MMTENTPLPDNEKQMQSREFTEGRDSRPSIKLNLEEIESTP
jgi:hypothetical protein